MAPARGVGEVDLQAQGTASRPAGPRGPRRPVWSPGCGSLVTVPGDLVGEPSLQRAPGEMLSSEEGRPEAGSRGALLPPSARREGTDWGGSYLGLVACPPSLPRLPIGVPPGDSLEWCEELHRRLPRPRLRASGEL